MTMHYQTAHSRPQTKLLLLLTLLLATQMLFISCNEEETTISVTTDTTKKLEDTVFTDMLRIVDHKFDTLTTRITSLERAVSNLQFFSIRQFRQLSGAIKGTESGLESLGKQVGKLEVDGRSSRIFETVLKRQVTELKASTNYLFGEIETSVVLINENIDKQTEVLKAVMEDTSLRNSQKTTTEIVEAVKREIYSRVSKTDVVNCSVDFSEVYERTDRRFSDLKYEMRSRMTDLIKEIEDEKTVRQKLMDMVEEKNEIAEEAVNTAEKPEHAPQDSPRSAPPQSFTARQYPPVHDKPKVNQESRHSSSSSHSYDENDERVMQALYNMTDSVLQAVSYFRHTGRMLENIMTNGERMLSKQDELGRYMQGLRVISARSIEDEPPFDGTNNDVPGTARGRRDGYQRTSAVFTREGSDCNLSETVLNNIVTVIKNGSQLLEVLTDLAQMSSTSLNKATLTLQDEVKRVEDVRTQMATTMLARATGDQGDPVTRLTNTTEKIFKLAEAVASNTGWLPVIYRHVQYSESLDNRTHHMTRQNMMLLRDIHQQLAHEASERRKAPGSALSNRISPIPQGELPGASSGTTLKNDGDNSDGNSDENDVMLDRESLETIYSTSLQLNRIMPALTKLLAEPDPLFTLVGGGRPDQGRLEIYHNGRWGTFCHGALTHIEANLICRHLGFRGGISAGAGHFGAGAGISWSLNVTCLKSGRCSAVYHNGQLPGCSHDEDAGVICDHMLRIIDKNESTESKTGRLEIHHRGVWLPVCGEGWSGYAARVACQQMGYPDGREMEVGEWLPGKGSRWMNKVACNGTETRLDACRVGGWSDDCLGWVPAGVRCL